MIEIKSQHYFKVYGGNKEEIEQTLRLLKHNKNIHSFTYEGMVALAELDEGEKYLKERLENGLKTVCNQINISPLKDNGEIKMFSEIVDESATKIEESIYNEVIKRLSNIGEIKKC